MKNNKTNKYNFPVDIHCYFGEVPPFDFEIEKLPFSKIYFYFNKITKKDNLDDSIKRNISSKIENASRRLLMMLMAKKKAIGFELRARLEVSQYLDPLFSLYEIEVLYHIEAMILFARSILDIFTYVSAHFLINSRLDSFTKFCKIILKSKDNNLKLFKFKIKSYLDDQYNWIHILSSINGRSLRDKIVHQTFIKLEYHEIHETSEKVYCHINFNDNLIPFNEFIENICSGVIDFCLLTEDIILNKYQL